MIALFSPCSGFAWAGLSLFGAGSYVDELPAGCGCPWKPSLQMFACGRCSGKRVSDLLYRESTSRRCLQRVAFHAVFVFF